MTRAFVSLVVGVMLLSAPLPAQSPRPLVGDVVEVVPQWTTTPAGDLLIVSLVRVATDRGSHWVTVRGGTRDGVTLQVSSQPAIHVGQRVAIDGPTTLTPVGGSDAYTPGGHVWGTSTVAYYVNPDNLYVTPADAIAAVQAAAAAWNTQGGAAIALGYAGTTTRNTLTLDYTNNVFFRNDASGAIAETYWWWDGTGRLVDADIVYHENYAFGTNTTGCVNGYYIESVGAHEFGHVLGLGHSEFSDATMYAYGFNCDVGPQTLSADDIAGIQFLYPGAPPDPAPAPKPGKGKGRK